MLYIVAVQLNHTKLVAYVEADTWQFKNQEYSCRDLIFERGEHEVARFSEWTSFGEATSIKYE